MLSKNYLKIVTPAKRKPPLISGHHYFGALLKKGAKPEHGNYMCRKVYAQSEHVLGSHMKDIHFVLPCTEYCDAQFDFNQSCGNHPFRVRDIFLGADETDDDGVSKRTQGWSYLYAKVFLDLAEVAHKKKAYNKMSDNIDFNRLRVELKQFCTENKVAQWDREFTVTSNSSSNLPPLPRVDANLFTSGTLKRKASVDEDDEDYIIDEYGDDDDDEDDEHVVVTKKVNKRVLLEINPIVLVKHMQEMLVYVDLMLDETELAKTVYREIMRTLIGTKATTTITSMAFLECYTKNMRVHYLSNYYKALAKALHTEEKNEFYKMKTMNFAVVSSFDFDGVCTFLEKLKKELMDLLNRYELIKKSVEALPFCEDRFFSREIPIIAEGLNALVIF